MLLCKSIHSKCMVPNLFTAASRSCWEFIGATLSLVVASPSWQAPTHIYSIGAARTCSELLGATLSLQVASSTGTYVPVLIFAPSNSELLEAKVPQ